MKLLVTLLGLCFLSIAPAGAESGTGQPTSAAPVTAQPTGAAPGTAPQPLSISVRGAAAQATRLPTYDPGIPISVAVRSPDGQHFDALGIAATGPSGISVRVPLTRVTQGMFTGSLTLSDPGTWDIRLLSRSGTLDTATTPITLDVESPPPSYAGLIGWVVGAAIFLIVGGGGFLTLRHVLRRSTVSELEQAA